MISSPIPSWKSSFSTPKTRRPGGPFEHLNDQLKQALRDYEAHPDDVYTLDEVKAELGLD